LLLLAFFAADVRHGQAQSGIRSLSASWHTSELMNQAGPGQQESLAWRNDLLETGHSTIVEETPFGNHFFPTSTA